MTDALADKLQIWGFEEGYIIFSDGSLGFALELKPLDISCWDNDRINSLLAQTRQFLNGLPGDFDIQFVQSIRQGNSKQILAHQALASTKENITALKLCAQRVDLLNSLDANGTLPHYNLSLYARKRPSKPLVRRPSLFKRSKLFNQIAQDELRRQLDECRRIKDDLAASLKSLGIESSSVDQHTLLSEIYSFWNPMRPILLESYDAEDIRSSILFTDAFIDLKGFSLADMHHRVLSLKLLPDQTFAGMASALKDLPFDSSLYLSIHVPNQQDELESLQMQRRLAFSMVAGKGNGVRDIDSEAKLNDIEALLEELVAQGEKVFHVSLNVVLKNTDEYELSSQVAQVLMKFRELGGAEAMEESLAAFDVFCELAQPNARAKERSKRMKTSNLADFLPLYGPWTGHEKPRVLLRSRSGSLVKFDPFSSELTNANQLVSGGSGAGKSYLTNILLLQMLKEDPKVFIVDIGGSYKKLTEALGGQFIPLGVGNGLSINPFDLKPGDLVPDDNKLKFLVSLVEIMTKEDNSDRLPKLERAELEAAILTVYNRNCAPTLSDLRSELLNNQDIRIKSIGRVLGPWCDPTPFGQFVDRKTNVALTNSIICFDLKGMETHSDLQAACLFIITDLVWRVIQQDRSTPKFLVFDECWKLLENDSGAAFIAECFRTFRKYFASAIAISQTIDDFSKSKIANAILPNSSIKWVLKQKGADKQSLQEVLSLNQNEIDAIDSLHQERGKYSEAFLMAGDERAVVAIESTPLEYWICTTDPRDLSVVDQFMKENPEKTNLEVFESLSQQYPHGIAAIS